MSRIGKNPISIPQNVAVALEDPWLVVKGKLGEERVPLMPLVDVEFDEKQIEVRPRRLSKRCRQAWGTTAALIRNALHGVSTGFERRLEVNGVGYRVNVQGKALRLQLGFSHDVVFPIPEDVKMSQEGERGQIIVISGTSRQRVGQVASDIRSFRPPEPYKGRGVKYLEEYINRKEGKKK